MTSLLSYTYTTDHVPSRAGFLAKDAQLMNAEMALNSVAGWTHAKQVYDWGAYAQSVATLELTSPLGQAVAYGTPVTAPNPDGSGTLPGIVHQPTFAQDSSIQIQYTVNPSLSLAQAVTTLCSVGGNPEPRFDTCFGNSGELNMEGFPTLTYNNYAASADTKNQISLGKISADIPVSTVQSYPSFTTFTGFYDSHTYADQWMQAAFAKGKTNLANGNVDFSIFQGEGTMKAIEIGVLTLNVWMQVVRSMEDALQECRLAKQPLTKQPFWDEAFSFYHGIGETSTDASLNLLHGLAQEHCARFGTCRRSQEAKVNHKIDMNFKHGKTALQKNHCDQAWEKMNEIVQLMAVPLVQGLLYHMYELDAYGRKRETVQAEVAAYGAAVLPLVHRCSPGDADVIFKNIELGKSTTGSFEVFKGALERQYDCWGITCEEVGGIVNVANPSQYERNAQPCGNFRSNRDAAPLVLAIVVPLLVVILLVVCVECLCCKPKRQQKKAMEGAGKDLEMTANDEPAAEPEHEMT